MVSKWITGGQTGGGPASLRRVHRSLALRLIARQPEIGRRELADRLGLSLMAVGRIVRELAEAGLIVESDSLTPVSGRGRPASGLSLRRDDAYVAGGVISAFAQEVYLLDLVGQVIATAPVNIREVTDGPAALSSACEQILELVKQAGVQHDQMMGAGFAIAARADSQTGMAGDGYLGWTPFNLTEAASSHLGMPVTVNNMGDTLLRAEAFTGCAQNNDSAVLLHCSTTLGANYVSGDQLISGAAHESGSIGHYPTRSTRLVCSCGQSDCLNCVASGWSILSRLKLVDGPVYQRNHILDYSARFRALVNGTLDLPRARVQRVVRDAGMALARGLRYLDLTLDAERVVLSGPLAGVEAYVAGVHAGLRKAGPPGVRILKKLVRGGLSSGEAAGVTALLESVFSPTLDLRRLNRIGSKHAGSREQ